MRPNPAIPGPLGGKSAAGLWWKLRLRAGLVFGLGLLPRLFDLALSLSLLIALAPLWLARAVWGWRKTGQLFSHEELLGRMRMPFWRLRFAGDAPFAGLAVLFNIVKGDMAFAGPRPLHEAEAAALGPGQAMRFAMRPGLFSPHSLRRKVGIAYDSEAASDMDFYYGETVAGNAGLLARSLLGSVLAGGAPRPTPPMLHLLGVNITNTTMDEALDWIVARARAGEASLTAFVNPDCLNIAYRLPPYRAVLAQAARVLPDGIGINLGCRILGVALKANVNGTDLFPRLCDRAAQEGLSLFLLGARPGVAEAAAQNMLSRYPGLVFAGVRDGYFQPEETDAVLAEINASGADILLVAFGAPKQELWLAEHHEQLRPAVRLGVGGLFDFYSGRIRRAPLWMREIGLEWTWRLLQEPGRMWRRYVIGNPLFLYRVWRQNKSEKSS
ncbi:MAG: WecB/TagA/CpsF family glycosyltransferase [Candidatus Methylumidiphilus sp.]